MNVGRYVLKKTCSDGWRLYLPFGSVPSIPTANAFKAKDQIQIPAKYRGDLWYTTNISQECTANLGRPAIFLGRISDADEVYWNNSLIGSTGFNGSSVRFLPHRDRVYRIDPKNISKTNSLSVRVVKIAADAGGIGMRTDQVLIGELATLSDLAFRRYALRTGVPLVLGIIIVVFGLYHLFLYFYLRSRKHYFTLGACMASYGVFAICYSFLPYEFSDHPLRVMVVHGLGSFWGLYFFGRFVLGDEGKVIRWIHRIQLLIASVFTVLIFRAETYDSALSLYFGWYLLLVPSTFGYFAYGLRRLHSNALSRFATLAAGAFTVALLYDVLVTIGQIGGEQWSVPTFMLVMSMGGLVLGRDFAHAFLNVEHTVDERTKDLRVANDRLRELDKMKERFFANVSHDFKTPIAVAFAHIEQAKQTVVGATAEGLAAAERSLNKLQGMIVDILDTLRAESGQLTLKWESTRPADLLPMWVEPYRPLCERKGLKLIIENQLPPVLRIPMDVGKIERVLANLVSNSIKFTGTGSITVRFSTDPTSLIMEVEDTGPGIPKNERDKVFDRFYQGFNTSLRDHGGSGIGLSFVKEVIDLHHGRVWVAEGLHGGSRFMISLPLSQDVEVVGEYSAGPSDARVEPLKGSTDVPYPSSTPETWDPKKPAILLVEDNPEVAQAIYSALRNTYNIYFALHGEDALKALSKTSVDCVLTDLMMPVMDGTTLLKRIRANENWKGLPVIILSSRGEADDVVEHLKLGAQDYVSKPFRQDVLLARLHAQIDRRRLFQRLLAADKMVTLGLLSSGLSHEIRNPLGVAQSSAGAVANMIKRLSSLLSPEAGKSGAEILEDFRKEQVRIDQGIELLNGSLDRIHRIVESMRGYASGSTKRIDVNVSEALTEAITLVQFKAKKKQVKLTREPSEGIHILGYASLGQVFVNLLDNAVDAVQPPSGLVTATVTRADEGVTVSVRDNGDGISPDILPHIFDPFVTTKAPNQGTGLGLYISKEIVHLQHGGSLKVHSDVGKGTEFVVTLPLEAPEMTIEGHKPFHGLNLQAI